MIRHQLANVLAIAGAAAMVYGFSLLHPAAGWLAGGLFLFAVGLGLAVMQPPKKGVNR